MTHHTRMCANCRLKPGPLKSGWLWCCWNPIGCGCAAESTPSPVPVGADGEVSG